MPKKILVIGQCSLHWGRMEFGNIGNYYIAEPFFRELHACFPGADIRTTMQFSEEFCRRERVTTLPIDLYYSWGENELKQAEHELRVAETIRTNGSASETTPYLEAVKWADLVIDFSGDIWGDNANFLGKDRLKVGLLKDLVAQTVGKQTAMIAGSPGPFSDPNTEALARHVYSRFDLVTNREPISTGLLKKAQFDTSKTVDLACPAFLFQGGDPIDAAPLLGEHFPPGATRRPVVGFIICGWNFTTGPFDRWPRLDEDYAQFAETVEFLSQNIDARVCLMSHSNGFDPPPAPFKLTHGRDYPIAKQLQRVLAERNIARDVFCLDGVYDAWQTKAIIGNFDMLISGRVHAAVAALSQSIPTVIIDYGHEPKAHKLKGFASIAGVDEYVADPSDSADLASKSEVCWSDRDRIKKELAGQIRAVQQLSRHNFELLRSIGS